VSFREIPRQFSLTIARWLTHVHDAGDPIGNPTTTGDATIMNTPVALAA
jgi:hypothetical protein